MGKDETWLDKASATDLEALASALTDQRVVPPYGVACVQQAGVDPAASRWLQELAALQPGLEPRMAAWMLRRLAAERREAHDRLARTASLVWSGLSEGHQATRDTRVVLDELFRKAEHYVLLSTFVIYDGRSVFAALVERRKERPGLRVDFFVNIKPTSDKGEEANVAAFLQDFTRNQWPSGARLPSIYYDPETLKTGSKRTSLHAKCVVVDDRWAFLTSANFTEAAQARNIEAGVLLDHPTLATTLAGRFHDLHEGGWLRRMTTGATPSPGAVRGGGT